MPEVTSLFPDDPVGARPFETGAVARKPTLGSSSLFPEDEQATRLRSAVESAKSPDQAARVLRLQTRTGLPPELIERNLDEVERETQRADFDAEKFRRDSPALAAWLAQNPKHAEVARDDLANLSRLDRLLGALQRGGYSLMQSGSALSLGANARAMAEADALDARLSAGEAPGAIPDSLDAAGYRWMSPVQRATYRHSLGEAGARQVGSIVSRQGQIEGTTRAHPAVAAALGSKSFADFWYHFSEQPVEFVLTVGAESLPQMAPALGLGLAGGVVGGLPLAAGGMGAGSFGVDYAASTLEALRDEGVDLKDRDQVAAAVADKELMKRVGQRAFSHAAPVAAFDGASGALAGLRLVPARQVAGVVASKSIVAPAARGAAELGAQATAQGTIGAAGEAAGLAVSGQDLDAGKLMAEFFGEFATAPADVGVMAATGVRRQHREMLRAKERTAFFEALGEGVSSSKVFERMPEKLREFIAQATRDGPVENVFVPVAAWQTFWQSQNVDPREAAAEVMGQTTLYEEAIRTGADIAIPLADYATKIAPNAQANAAFSEEIRLRADELNAREAKEVEAELAAQVAAGAQETPGASSAQKVREDIVGQLTGLGFDRGSIDAYASMYERTFATLGERAGVDPFELFSRYGLRVGRPLPEVLKPAARVDALDALLDRVRALDTKAIGDGAQVDEVVMALAQHLDALGIDLNTLSNAEIKKLLEQASGTMGESGDVTFEQDERKIQVKGQWRPIVDSEGRLLGQTFAEQLAFWLQAGDAIPVDEQGRPLANAIDPLSGNILYQPAYHGSTHDFNKFSTDKIGTGEGAQAYGWGLYFAENPAVATGYHRALAEDPEIQEFKVGRFPIVRGGQFIDYSPRDNTALENVKGTIIESLLVDEHELRAAQAGGKLNEYVHGKIDGFIDGYFDPEADKELIAAAKKFKKSVETWGITFKLGKTTGGVYQVDIPDDVVARMLLWDKPLGEQPKEVFDAITGMGLDSIRAAMESVVQKLHPAIPPTVLMGNIFDIAERAVENESPTDLERALKNFLKTQSKELSDQTYEDLEAGLEPLIESLQNISGGGTMRDLTGEEIYRNLEQRLGSDEAASKALEKAGIPGIKYLDQGSRNSEKQTHNLVVFNDKHVTLTHKDGSPVTQAERDEFLQEMSDTKRGRISFGADRQFNIELFERADLSTFIHESGHFYLEVFGDIIEEIGAQDQATLTDTQRQMIRDYGDLLAWLGVANRAEIGVEQHEQFARGLEAYMRDGKAPSRELRSVFAKFRAWLVNIYRSLTQLNVELSPEVRAVMDRMLATDREIEAAQREADIAPLFIDAAAAGMNAAEFAAYSETVRAAGEQARDELQAKLFRQMKREQQAWWKREREQVLAEVAAEVYAQPDYIALSALQRGTLPDGSPLPDGVQAVKLNRDWLIDSYGKEFLKRLPRPYVYAKEGGINPELAAPTFGFRSGDELVMALVNARPMRALIEAETDARMKERHGDMMLDGTIAEAATIAVNGIGRSQIVEAELKALNRAIAGSVIPPADVVNGMAADWIARQKVRELRPTAYLMATQRAAKEAFSLVSEKNDRSGAMRAKLREQMNLALYREATRAQEQTESIVDYMRSFDRAAKRERIGKAGGDYLDQIDGLLDRFEFKKVALKVLERRRALSQWAADKEKQGLPVSLPENLLDEARRQNYREMTVEELAGLRDAVKHIEHLATLKNKLLKAKAKRELDEAVADMAQSIREHGKAKGRQIETRLPGDEAARLVSGWFASHRKLASFARQMDGFEDGGQVWEYVIRPINEAAAEEAAMKEAATLKLGELFAGYKGKEGAELYRKRHIAEINAPLTKMGRLMIALNWGNEGNRQRVMSGYGWNEKQVEAILATLDARDWKFVQGVWDFIDSYWPQIEAKEKRVDGVAPAKVERAKVATRFGEFPGGYFPIKYDERQSAKAGANLEAEFADLAKKASYTRATTRRGHTEARVEKVDMPVRLDFGVIFEHVNQVIHDLTHHEMLIDAGRLLGHKELQAAIYDTYGDIVFREFKKSLVDIAHGDTPAANAWEASLSHLRQGVSIAYMGWNLMTSLQQPLGLTNAMVRIGPKWVAKGLTRWFRDAASLENSVAWVHDRSEFMRLRHKTQQREIAEIRNAVGLQSGRLSGWVDEALRTVTADHLTKQGIVDSYFWLIAKAQMVADVPTWLGGYEKAMAAGETEERAIALADQAVLDSQGGGQIKDLASVQRGGPMLKLWTNFYSIFNVTFNLAVESTRRTNFRDPISIGRLAVDYLLLTVMPATLAALIKHAITGGDDDDGEELARRLARENLSYLLGMMVGLREIGAASLGFYGYEGPAGARFFASVGKFAKQSAQGEADAAFWKALNESAGILLHYPAGQVKRTVEGFNALAEGSTVNPLALVFGAPKP